MKKKLFVAIDPPEEVKERLSSLKSELPARWTSRENIHMTLLFLGQVDDDRVEVIRDNLKGAIEGIKKFDLEVSCLSYAPPDSRPPKMIWAMIANSEPLKELREKVCEALGMEADEFIPHMTLARISAWKFRQLDEDEIPGLPEDNFSFKADSVSLMESKTFRGKVRYELIDKMELK